MKTRSRSSLLVVLTLLAVGLLGMPMLPTGAQAGEGQPVPVSAQGQTVVVRLYVRDRDQLGAVAGRLDIWEAHLDDGYVVAAVGPAQVEWLQGLGYRMEIDQDKTAALGIQAALDPRYYYFDSYYTNPNGLYITDFMQAFNAEHPELTELYDIGDAWLAGEPGEHDRDIWVLRVANEDPAFGPIETRPAFFLFATIHAREVSVPELAMRYIRYLVEGYNGEGGYGVDADATWLVDHNVVYVLVMQNPDGHWVNEQDIGAYRRKNMDSDDGCNDPGSWGVDLNRNHSFFWGCCGGSSPYPCDETYRGPERASEPETQAFQAFFSSVMLDQNGDNGDDEYGDLAPPDTTGIMISLHSYSDLVLWPWDLPEPPPNEEGLTVIGRKLAYLNTYEPGSIGYPVDGSTDDWTYGKFGIPSYTFEVGQSGGSCGGFFPQYGCIDGIDGMPRSFWAENKPAFLYAHKIARTPYMTSEGPDAESLAVAPGVVTPGMPVELTAVIADHRYGNDPLAPIGGAEFFIDTPGEDGAGTAMSPADGSWGGLSEAVTATLDTTDLPVGRHYVLVHGQNTSGDWGPFTAVFLYVMEEGVSPVIEGYVRDGVDNAPLEATVTAGMFQAETDPATGFYSMMVISDTYDITAEAAGYAPVTEPDVPAHNYQVVEQDLYLFPYCTLFEDDVEGGNLGWTADPPWAITDEASYSPSHSWTDSPGLPYGNNINISLTSPVLDFKDHSDIALSFWHIYDIQYMFDHGYVEYSTDGGATWATAASFSDDAQLVWTQESIALPGLDDQANARIRFRLQTTPYVQQDGWHLDDIALTGSGPSCITPMTPEPEFASNSPVEFGQPVQFVNQTLGTPPLEYAWDFGDGIGSSTEVNPEYLYQAAGTYDVTLVATNAYGTASVTHPVTMLPGPCQTITGTELTQLTVGTVYPGDTVEYSADILPDDAGKPYTYTVDYGDGTAPVLDTSSEDPLELEHQFAAPGSYEVDFAAWNCDMVAPVTDTVTTIVTEPGVCVELTAIAIEGPTTGAPGTYAFTTAYEPLNATLPIAYAWDNGDSGDSSVRTLGLGTHTLTVTATNCVDAVVTDTHSIMIRRYLYLPLVLRNP